MLRCDADVDAGEGEGEGIREFSKAEAFESVKVPAPRAALTAVATVGFTVPDLSIVRISDSVLFARCISEYVCFEYNSG